MTAAAPIVEVRELRKAYGDLVAVDGVSFTVQRGGSLAIVGESGSGKTSIAKLITGMVRTDAGSISVCGRDRSAAARSGAERRQRAREVQLVFQDPYSSLDPRYTAAQSILEVLSLHGGPASTKDRATAVAELGDLVGLGPAQLAARPVQLSGGQRQRVAIARALAAKPDVIVLDEAVAALDVSLQAQVLNLLADIRETTGVTYLFISHDLGVVRQVTDEILVMHRGRVVESGATAEVLRAPRHPYTRRLIDSVPRPGWVPRRTVRAQAGPGAVNLESGSFAALD